MEIIIAILAFAWLILATIIKIIVYVTYFVPFIGFKILQYLNLWPNVWPLG